jgi:signal transduction histidine kinase/ActR/RegA family two-component response regulator
MVHDARGRASLRRLTPLLISPLAIAAALWAELAISGFAPHISLTPLSLAVALMGWYGGLAAGLLSLLLAAAGIDYFLLVPGRFWTYGSVPALLEFALYTGGWLAFCLAVQNTYRRNRNDHLGRLEAERLAAHADRLAQLTAALGQARTPSAAIEASIQEPVHALKADAGMFLLIRGDGARADLARAIGYNSEDVNPWNGATLDDRSPVADAVGRGAAVIVESRARSNAEYPELSADLYPRSFAAVAAVPLVIGSQVVAVVRLDFRKPHTFSSEDREYLFSLGASAAQALDRTWQFESAQRARVEAESLRARADQELNERQKIEEALRASETQYRTLAARTSRLHGLTAALSESVTLRAVAQAVVHQGRIVVGATSGEVMVLGEDRTYLETLYSENQNGGDPQRKRIVLEPGFSATEAIRTGRPVFVGSFSEWQERYSRSAALAADGGFVSYATLPLMVEANAIGVLAFYFTVPVNFDESYTALLVSVAQHCAQALDRARLYEASQLARTDAEAANRLKDEFVSIVSHELRTPLNAILGWTSMLQRGSLSSAVAGRALQSIHDNATRQTRLIDELLDFSRIVAGRSRLELEDLDLRDLIRGVVESVFPTAAAAGLDLQLSAIPPVIVHADLRRLEQVFFNLLSNAIKFTPAGGRVSILSVEDDGVVEVRVSDTGVGIEKEFLPFAFDRFRQADSTMTRAHGGLGLGLSIARQLVEAHEGTIEVESEGKGRGSTFVVRLPVAGHGRERNDDSEARAMPPAIGTPAAPRLDGVRVLIVDDEPDTREIICHELEGCGASVTEAGNASEALHFLETNEVDVLLADVAMPDEDGYSLIRKIRSSPAARVASIPAAAVTAHARDDERKEALAAGFQLHLAKPFDPAELARAVETLVRGDGVVH